MVFLLNLRCSSIQIHKRSSKICLAGSRRVRVWIISICVAMVTKCTVQCGTEAKDRYMSMDFPQICDPCRKSIKNISAVHSPKTACSTQACNLWALSSPWWITSVWAPAFSWTSLLMVRQCLTILFLYQTHVQKSISTMHILLKAWASLTQEDIWISLLFFIRKF